MHQDLAIEVLRQALRDARRGTGQAQRFLSGSEDFRFWCNAAGLDPDVVARRVPAAVSQKSLMRRCFTSAEACKG